MEGNTDSIKCVAVTSDYKYFVSGSVDKTIRVWNLLKKRQTNVLKGHLNEVTTLAVTCNNKYIISGSLDNTIRIWYISKKKQKSFFNFDDSINSLEADHK